MAEIHAQICMKHGKACFRCEDCGKETLDETRARFRREFPVMAAEYDAHMAIANTEQLLYFWHYFAAGAGHPNDVKFKGD